jgi:hypothetical protein
MEVMSHYKTYRKRRSAAREAAWYKIEKQIIHRDILNAQPSTVDVKGCRVFCLDFEVLKN